MKTERRPLGLYVHIPFCVRKCSYCDFLSAPGSPQQIEAYLEALKRQTVFYGRMLQETGRKAGFDYAADSVFIGGGTPSLLSGEQMTQLLDTIRSSFCLTADAEITAECNPGTLTKEKLHAYRDAGINRLSIGLQSADNRELSLLGRIHTWEAFLENFSQARQAGFDTINIDLMSALPGQTPEHFQRTLEKAAALAPEHISSYSLIIEEGTPFYKQYASGSGLPDEEEAAAMDQMTVSLLGRYGYRRYEISNYALPGKECRHNLKYWRCEEYLGLGSGASSYMKADCGLWETKAGCEPADTKAASELPERRTDRKASKKSDAYIRTKNPSDTEAFLLTDWSSAVFEEAFVLSRGEQMEEMAFLGLRTVCGVDLQAFAGRFKIAFTEVFEEPVRKYRQLGLLVLTERYAYLTEAGMEVSNVIMADFLLSE